MSHCLTLLVCAFFYKNFATACDLVPSSEESCFELRATPYITTANSLFGPTIEGAGVNKNGHMFAVDFGTRITTNQLGQLYPKQKLFYRDNITSSYFNGIRFLNAKTAFVADVSNHRVLKLSLDANGNVVANGKTYCSDTRMIQPNDITLSKTGTVFTSGMNWLPDTGKTDGDIWSCRRDGTVARLEVLGRTNGIDLTPNEKHLYVSESYNKGGVPIVQKIWKYKANAALGTISGKKLFADFASIDQTAKFDIDGMKTDTKGNLYVARYGASHVAILSVTGQLIGKIGLSFPNPTNLEFGGPNGRDLFIVGQCAQQGKGCVDRISVKNPGRSWSMLQSKLHDEF